MYEYMCVGVGVSMPLCLYAKCVCLCVWVCNSPKRQCLIKNDKGHNAGNGQCK